MTGDRERGGKWVSSLKWVGVCCREATSQAGSAFHLFWVARDVRQADGIQFPEKGLSGANQGGLEEADSGDPALAGARGQTFDESCSCDGAVFRRSGETNAAGASANGFEIAELGEKVHYLDEVMIGNVEGPRDLPDGRQFTLFHRGENEGAQRVVRELFAFHPESKHRYYRTDTVIFFQNPRGNELGRFAPVGPVH